MIRSRTINITDKIEMNVTTIVPRRMITKKGMTKRKAMPLANRINRIPVVPPNWKMVCYAWHRRCKR